MTGPTAAALLERDDSFLLVIDLQPGFFGPSAGADPALDGVVARAAWLVAVATALDVPVLVTEEDPRRNGRTDSAVLDAAPGAPVFEKRVFGAAGQRDILAAIRATRCGTAVLVGAETDVCVAQTALGLVAAGLRVAVVTDATFSPGEMQGFGLRRMRDAGVIEVHAKGVYYEWIRTLAGARDFQDRHPALAEPPGFSL